MSYLMQYLLILRNDLVEQVETNPALLADNEFQSILDALDPDNPDVQDTATVNAAFSYWLRGRILIDKKE